MAVINKELPRVLPAKIPTQRRFVSNYVALMSGLLRLTDTELLVLSEIVWELYIGKLASTTFSPEGRSDIRKSIEKAHKKKMSVQNFNNYLMSLKRKGAIQEKEGTYNINPWLYPRDSITFTYEVYENISKYI